MFQVLMGAMCAVSFGVADFMASRSSRAIGARNALAGMLLVSSFALTLVAPFVIAPAELLNPGTAIACFHGAAMAAALLLFFRALELGPVSVAAPIVAAHPIFIVSFALIMGSRPSGLQLVAMMAIIAALVYLGTSNRASPEPGADALWRSPRAAIGSAVAASVIYAFAIISAQQAMLWSDEFSVLWLGRLFGLIFLFGVFAVARERPDLPRAWWPFFLAHGILDSAWASCSCCSEASASLTKSLQLLPRPLP